MIRFPPLAVVTVGWRVEMAIDSHFGSTGAATVVRHDDSEQSRLTVA
jgi:hypothetical protein